MYKHEMVSAPDLGGKMLSFRQLPTWLERQTRCVVVTRRHGTSEQKYSADMPRERVKRMQHPCNTIGCHPASQSHPLGLRRHAALRPHDAVCDLPGIVSRTHAAEIPISSDTYGFTDVLVRSGIRAGTP